MTAVTFVTVVTVVTVETVVTKNVFYHKKYFHYKKNFTKNFFQLKIGSPKNSKCEKTQKLKMRDSFLLIRVFSEWAQCYSKCTILIVFFGNPIKVSFMAPSYMFHDMFIR